MRRAVYQGWLGHGNLGDEAIFRACIKSLPQIGWRGITFDEVGAGPLSPARIGNAWTRLSNSLIPGRLAMLGGGTILNQTHHWLEQYRLLRRMTRKPVPVFSPGVADPSYWSEVRDWRDTRGEWREELEHLPEVGVRGPISERLLKEAGFRNVVMAGDPAIIFHRPLDRSASTDRRTVSVNVGSTNGLMWGNEARALATIADASRRLARAGFEVRIVPVYRGDLPVCRELARAAGLSQDVVEPLMLDADAFLRHLDGVDVVLSMKLHAAVFAAVANVPFVAVEHQPKVRDFTESIGWTQLTFRSDALRSEQLVRAVQEIHSDHAAFRERLDARVREIAETFRAYARRLEDFLLAL